MNRNGPFSGNDRGRGNVCDFLGTNLADVRREWACERREQSSLMTWDNSRSLSDQTSPTHVHVNSHTPRFFFNCFIDP